MAMVRYSFPIILALLVGGCTSALGPDASARLPALAATQGAAINLYWPCLIDVPTPDVLKDQYTVEIDGKEVGQMTRCQYQRFETTPGIHAVRLRSNFVLDIAGAFGHKGLEYTVPPGRPIYIRLTYYKYVEYREVPAEQGIREITNMAKE